MTNRWSRRWVRVRGRTGSPRPTETHHLAIWSGLLCACERVRVQSWFINDKYELSGPRRHGFASVDDTLNVSVPIHVRRQRFRNALGDFWPNALTFCPLQFTASNVCENRRRPLLSSLRLNRDAISVQFNATVCYAPRRN